MPEMLLPRPVKISGRVSIARSFTYKHNAGNYESRDFFCSQSAECDAEDAAAVSAKLYEFCKRQVMIAVQDWIASTAAPITSQDIIRQRRAG